jgi:mRNA interferase RelE/StbE
LREERESYQKSLPQGIRRRIDKAISALAQEQRPAGCKKLKATKHYRIRISDCRVIYDVEDEKMLILIIEIGHRKDVYRNL